VRTSDSRSRGLRVRDTSACRASLTWLLAVLIGSDCIAAAHPSLWRCLRPTRPAQTICFADVELGVTGSRSSHAGRIIPRPGLGMFGRREELANPYDER
jgi:hypothetical protein